MSLPQQMLVEARIKSQPLEDPGAAVAARLAARLDADWSGRRVAVAVGSRGIDRYAEVVRAVVATLQAAGARPFVMPAMGSHGGGKAPGQVEVLQALGITEERSEEQHV